MSTQTHDPRQYQLPFETAGDDLPPLVLVLRSIDWRRTPFKRRQWNQIRELLIAVVLCGARDGCHASVASLIWTANKNCNGDPPIRSADVFHRVRKAAEDAGVLHCEHEHLADGGVEVYREVNEALLKKWSRKNPSPAQARPKPAACPTRTRPEPKPSSNKEQPLNPRTIQPVDNRSDDRKDFSGSSQCVVQTRLVVDERDAAEAVRICRRMPEPTAEDWRMAVRAACLARGPMSEHWLHDAVAGVAACRPKNPWAYLNRSLANGCNAVGRNLSKMLRAVGLPAEYSHPPPLRPMPRTCGGARLEDL